MLDYYDEEALLNAFSGALRVGMIDVVGGGSSLVTKVRRCLLNCNSLCADNGKASLPPDFYCELHSIMFDVMCINDSEVKKSYNPVKIRERARFNEFVKRYGDVIKSKDVIVTVQDEIPEAREHTYDRYVRMAKRVISEHISKIPLWVQKCPGIKYKGLFIYDETDVYFEGWSEPTGKTEPGHEWRRLYRGCAKDVVLHEPWRDRNFVEQVFSSDIDFLVWFCPCKVDNFAMQLGRRFPGGAILDTRYAYDGYVDYKSNLVM